MMTSTSRVPRSLLAVATFALVGGWVLLLSLSVELNLNRPLAGSCCLSTSS